MGDQFQYIKLPDGTYGKFAADATDDQIKSVLARDFPQHFGQSASGNTDPLGIENALSSATISPAQTGTRADLESIKNDLLHGTGTSALGRFLQKLGAPGLAKGTSEGAANMIGGPMLGPITAAHGVASLPSHPIQGANETIRGFAQAVALPGAVLQPGMMAYAAPGVIAQHYTQKGLQAIGTDPDYAELISNVVGLKAGEKLAKWFPSKTTATPELTNKVTAKVLTDAINPSAAEMPKYQSTLEEQLPQVTEYARINQMPIRNKADLAAAMKSAADTKRAQFQGLVDATGDQTVSTNDIPGYGGATKTYGTASIRQIYDRLTQVNSELFNPYNKASERASGAAVKSSGDLAAEAAALRKTLYSEMAKHTGKDADTLADINGSSGALGYLAEKTQLAADTERASQNKAQQGPVSLSPFTNTKNFVLDKYLNKLRGNPADKAISDTAGNMAMSPDVLQAYMGMRGAREAGPGGEAPPESPTQQRPAVERRATPRPSSDDLKTYYDTRFQEIRKGMAESNDPKELARLRSQLDGLQSLMKTHSLASNIRTPEWANKGIQPGQQPVNPPVSADPALVQELKRVFTPPPATPKPVRVPVWQRK